MGTAEKKTLENNWYLFLIEVLNIIFHLSDWWKAKPVGHLLVSELKSTQICERLSAFFSGSWVRALH